MVTAHASSVATASPVIDSGQEKPLPLKPAGLSGPAPGSNVEPLTNYPPPHVHATPFASLPPYQSDQYAYADEAIPPKPDQLSGGGAGPAPHGGGQHHGYIHPSYSVLPSVQQPTLPLKGASTAGSVLDTAHQQGQDSNPLQILEIQPQPKTYQQPRSYQPFSLDQYHPYQPPVAGRFTTPYTMYQQPAIELKTWPANTEATIAAVIVCSM